MKPLVIYHDNCADGFGAAWAAWVRFNDKAEYLDMNYNDPCVLLSPEGELAFPAELKDRDVYILDFSFKPEIMAAMLDQAKYITWLDHHKTAFEDRGLDPKELYVEHVLNGYTVLDPNKSGCVLAWKYFQQGHPVPEGLLLIQDRDLWRWELSATRDFATALRSKPFEFESFNRDMWDPKALIDSGRAMNKLFDQQLADITSRPMPVVLLGREHPTEHPTNARGLATNCTPQFASEAGNILAQQSGTFGATWCVGQDGKVAFSLRSIGDYDVSELARRYGGGGHRNAAGFSVPFDSLEITPAAKTLYVYSS